MALTIENGTGVAGAVTYQSVAEARAYAAARGLVLPADDTEVERLLILAMDFIEAHRGEFQGSKTSATQALQWPRVDATLDGFDIPEDEIPLVLKHAQAQLACDAATVDLMPNGEGREILREKLDVLETQYAQSGITNVQPIFTKAKALLRPLLKQGLFGGLSSVRV